MAAYNCKPALSHLAASHHHALSLSAVAWRPIKQPRLLSSAARHSTLTGLRPVAGRTTAVSMDAKLALDSASVLPRVVVLDLDYTIWPFWCEMYTTKDTPRLYPEALDIMQAIRTQGILLAAASRTPTPHVATAFMDKLGITPLFDSVQLIPAADGFDARTAQKDVCHLPNIKSELGVEYTEMLFFDDEARNIRRVSKIGVCSVLVPTDTGFDVSIFRQGLLAYAGSKQRGSS